MNRLTVTLPDELDVLVGEGVQSGNYASSSEVVRDALRYWRDRQEVRLTDIKRRIQASIDDPHPGFSSGELGTHMDGFLKEYKVEGAD